MKRRAQFEEAINTMSNTIDSVECDREMTGLSVLPSVTIGRIAAIESKTGFLVDFPGNNSGELILSRSLVDITEREIGKEIALLFEDGDSAKPIILGIMRGGRLRGTNVSEARFLALPVEAFKIDEDIVILSAKREIVLQCGKASITLTSAGKLLINGEYVVSRSSGVNKIRGGSVQIN